MTIALISKNPLAVVQTWPSGPVDINVPGVLQAYQVGEEFETDDYKMITVTETSAPDGMVKSTIAYKISEKGDVTETCEFVDAPKPDLAALAQVALDATDTTLRWLLD